MNSKIHFQLFTFAISMLIILIGFSCNDNPLSPNGQIEIKQVAGCQKNILNKSSLTDSCFIYTFKNELNLEFCVTGNCCPDSNRYLLSSKILGDTIEIAVKDTAANLCKCLCNYIIQAEFPELNRDRYFIKCLQIESTNKKVLYFNEANRN